MKSDDVIKFYRSLNRVVFVDGVQKQYAHEDRPLPIGFEQTISQPSLVLNMTQQLELDKSCRVLEIGTGSGYQTVFLAEFADVVYTVERIPELSASAKRKLNALGYTNIHYRVGDGSEGWEEYAPYDRIITTAAAGHMPDKLLAQLRPGGNAIAPVGQKGYQDLLKIRKDKKGIIKTESLGKVTFVEMKGAYGWAPHLEDK